jgi:hypothetical protein
VFEKALKDKLKEIFDLDKVTFDLPSSSKEQECLFVEVQSSKNTIKDGAQIAKVTGKITVFGSLDKMPYGYFSKKIHEAGSKAKDLFFYDFEENQGTFRNISERSLSFVFFYDGQYDPNLGTINSIQIEVSDEYPT